MVKKKILGQLPFYSGALPYKYLRLPLLTRKMRVEYYSLHLEKIRVKIKFWMAR